MAFIESSFTIRFLEHVPEERRTYCLNRMRECGATINSESDCVFQVVCGRPNELSRVGRLLFRSHLRKICTVVATSGIAKPRADAYYGE